MRWISAWPGEPLFPLSPPLSTGTVRESLSTSSPLSAFLTLTRAHRLYQTGVPRFSATRLTRPFSASRRSFPLQRRRPRPLLWGSPPPVLHPSGLLTPWCLGFLSLTCPSFSSHLCVIISPSSCPFGPHLFSRCHPNCPLPFTPSP